MQSDKTIITRADRLPALIAGVAKARNESNADALTTIECYQWLFGSEYPEPEDFLSRLSDHNEYLASMAPNPDDLAAGEFVKDCAIDHSLGQVF